MGTEHEIQAAMADLAAVDCKIGVPNTYSQHHKQYVCACFTVISRHVLLPYAGPLDSELFCMFTGAVDCLAF